MTASVLGLALLAQAGGLAGVSDWAFLRDFCQAVTSIAARMWWGVLIGVVLVGLINLVPRDLMQRALSSGGVVRAALAGLAFDLCNHGILLLAAKFYERGASLGQTMAFLVASPWNSLSFTVILASLIGWGWTLSVVFLSFVIAVITGFVFDHLSQKGVLPHRVVAPLPPPECSLKTAFWRWVRTTRWDRKTMGAALRTGMAESTMILRWLCLGVVLAAALQASMDGTDMNAWFGPTMFGLGMTLLAATVIEICSEGSTPLAADLFDRAQAPGNGFVFLMAGAASDYTEILILREVTRSWRIALFLPLVTIPQIVTVGFILNQL